MYLFPDDIRQALLMLIHGHKQVHAHTHCTLIKKHFKNVLTWVLAYLSRREMYLVFYMRFIVVVVQFSMCICFSCDNQFSIALL